MEGASDIHRAMVIGASGYIPKTLDNKVVASALQLVFSGGVSAAQPTAKRACRALAVEIGLGWMRRECQYPSHAAVARHSGINGERVFSEGNCWPIAVG